VTITQSSSFLLNIIIIVVSKCYGIISQVIHGNTAFFRLAVLSKTSSVELQNVTIRCFELVCFHYFVVSG